MSENLRWVVGGIALVMLLGAGLALRSYVARTQVASQPESSVSDSLRRPTARVVPRRGADVSQQDADAFESSEPGDDAAPAARAGAPGTTGQATSGPQIRTTGHETAAQNPIAKQKAGAAAAAGSEVAAVETPTNPRGPKLAITFDGNTTAADQTPPLISQDIQFDAAADAALFPPTAMLAYPDRGGIDPEQGTVAFWLRMTESPGPNGRAILDLGTGTWENHLNVAAGPTYVRFLATSSDGTESVVFSRIDFSQGDWHHTAVTWGEAQLALIVDGAVRDSTTYSGSFSIPPGAPLYIASPRGGFDPNPGVVAIRDLQTFQQILTSDELAAIMAEKAPSK